MAKRMTKAEQKAIAGLVFVCIGVGTPIFIVTKMAEMVGWSTLIWSAIVCLAAYMLFKRWRISSANAKRLAAIDERRAHLLSKYGDSEIVERIMNRTIWKTQTEEQLRDTLGNPVDTDEKVTKKIRRVVWKYHQTGANRFGLRVTVENGVVVGWDEKL